MTVLLRSHWRDGLRRALARVHRHYAGVIQARRKRTGHFRQVCFGAVVHGRSRSTQTEGALRM